MKKPRNSINGWINLYKPLGITSADAVNKVKWLLKPQKIGHAGTLDPLATGILPLALGEGTKCINLLMDAKKTYEFAVTFGERRSTDDAEGEVVATSTHIPTDAEIQAALPRFTGDIMQLPPAYSALKIAGRRAYDLARAGEEVVLEPRPVSIYSLEFLGWEAPQGASSPCGRRLEEGTLDGNDALPLHLPPTQPSPARGEDFGHRPLARYRSAAQEQQSQSHAKSLRREMTEVEKKLWYQLRAKQLAGMKFRRQQVIDGYIADFVCLEKRLIIELDGGQHTVEADAKRTSYVEAQGFQLLRFWNHEVLENIEGVLTVILQRLETNSGGKSLLPLRARSEKNQDLRLDSSSPRVGGGGAGYSGDVPLTTVPPPNPPPQGGRALASARFRATVSKGTYIRSLGRDIAQAVGSEGYISRLHRSAVGPFTDADAISLDFIAESVHKAAPEEIPGILPLHAALDDIPALALDGQQLSTLRYGQQVLLPTPHPDAPQLAATHNGQLVGLVRIEGNRVISNRLLNV